MQNLFPPKGSLVNAPQKKKSGEEKQKKRGGEKAKGKRRKGSGTFSEKKFLEILLSAHARTLKAVIWHQEQKLVQHSTCKQRFGQFGFFLARQRPKNGLTRFKRHFLAKCPGVNGLTYKNLLKKPSINLSFRTKNGVEFGHLDRAHVAFVSIACSR